MEDTEIWSLMGQAELARSGLAHLSAEERQFLQNWLTDNQDAIFQLISSDSQKSGRTVDPGDSFGLEQTDEYHRNLSQSAQEIRSRISGPFNGWSGRTVFRLDNGHVWRQVGSGNFYVNETDPEIIIRRGAMGSYLLQLEGYGRTVRVRRIE